MKRKTMLAVTAVFRGDNIPSEEKLQELFESAGYDVDHLTSHHIIEVQVDDDVEVTEHTREPQ